jgi:hypothetical protein
MFKDLKKFVADCTTEQQQYGQLPIFKGLPFYRWDLSEVEHRLLANKSNNTCCFNHQISLPEKNGVKHQMYDYERMVFDTLFKDDGSANNKHVWIKKATGLGITELLLRIIVYLCVKDDELSGSQIVIFTGPRIDLAIDLISRLKKLFYSNNLITSFATKETVAVINNVRVEAFPSHHVDSARGLPNVSFIFLDESDYFPPGQQQDARDVSERYIAKSNPYIVMVSTPNAPEGLFESIEKEPEDTCLYKRMFLDYTYGLSKIYTAEEIEKVKQSPSFEREYNLKYLGKIGNVFHTKDIEAAIEKGRKYNPDNFTPYYSSTSRSMGIDPAYGSSAFGIVVTEWADGLVQILYAEEYHRPDYNEMLSLVYDLMSKYQVDKVYIDGANPSFIKSLKLQIGEDADYDKVIARYRSEGFGDDAALKDMTIVPVNFNKEHKAMLGHCKMILENEPRKIAINPDKFDKLITSLRTAVDNDGVLDKESISYNDIFDAFRLALKFYRYVDSSEYD